MALGNITVRIRADVAGLNAGLSQAQASLQRAGRSMQSVGASMQSVGQTMTMAVTLPIVAMGAAILRTAGNFEYAMNRVGALSGATGGMLDQLRAKAALMGATTAFTATDAADALGFMSMAGMRAADQLEALPAVLQLAASAGLDMATSADIITNVLAGMGMQVSELGRLNDTLVRTFTRTNTSLTQLGDAMKYVAPVAAAARVEVEAVAASIGFMGNAGIQGSMAGTSLRGAISRLLAPTDQIREAMQGAGASVKFFEDGSLDLIETFRTFEPHANNVNLLMTVFGQRAGPGVAAILGQGVDALEAFVIELELAEGTAARIQGVTMQGLRGSMASLESAVEALGLAIANSGLLEFVTNMVTDVANFTRTMATLNPEILRTTTVFASLAATIPLVTLAVGALVRSMGFIFGALAGPVGIIALLVGVAVGVPIFNRLNNSVRGANEAMERHRELLQGARTAMSAFANATDDTRDAMQELAESQLEVARAATMQAHMTAEASEARAGPVRYAVGPGQAPSLLAYNAARAIRDLTPAGQQAIRDRAAADAMQASYMELVGSFNDAEAAPRMQEEFEAAINAYREARDAMAGGMDHDARMTWLAANPQHAQALRRGGIVDRTGSLADFDPEAALAGDMPGMPASPSQRREGEIETLRALSAITAETSDELERMTAIQEVMNEAVAGGEPITLAQAAAFVDERDALQGVIDKQRDALAHLDELAEAEKEFTGEIERDEQARRELTAAAREGTAAYERMLIVQRLLSQNPALTSERAGEIADQIQRSTEELDRATENMNRFEQLWDSLGQTVASAFEQAILQGEELGDVLKSLARDIAALVLRTLVTEPLANSISNFLGGIGGGGGGGGGGKSSGGGGGMWGSIIQGIGSFFGGFFADGGYLPPGKWGVAGENGAEPIFGGKTGLSVIPAGGSGGGSMAIDASMTIYAPGADAAALAKLEQRVAMLHQQLPGKIRAVMGDQNGRGRGWSP